jgi:hypothetical protein
MLISRQLALKLDFYHLGLFKTVLSDYKKLLTLIAVFQSFWFGFIVTVLFQSSILFRLLSPYYFISSERNYWH